MRRWRYEAVRGQSSSARFVLLPLMVLLFFFRLGLDVVVLNVGQVCGLGCGGGWCFSSALSLSD